jgi:hypothetical protein
VPGRTENWTICPSYADENSADGEINVSDVAGTRPVACNSAKFSLLIVRKKVSAAPPLSAATPVATTIWARRGSVPSR